MLIFSTLSDILQVRGTPASGKTILSRLLAQHIHQLEQDPAAHIIRLNSWGTTKVWNMGGWEAFLRAKGWQQGRKPFFIIDEAQMSYGDIDLWVGFFKELPSFKDQFAIAFASYGSPNSRISVGGTPIIVSDRRRVALVRIDHDDGLGAVGLLFSHSNDSPHPSITSIRHSSMPSVRIWNPHSRHRHGLGSLVVRHPGTGGETQVQFLVRPDFKQ